MAAKQMAISFGIGAVLSGTFTKSFSTADSLINEVNKKLNILNKSRNDLDKYKKLQILNKDTLKELLESNKELQNLKKNTSGVTEEDKKLKNEIIKLEKKIEKLKGTYKKNREELNETKKSLEEQNISINDTAKAYENLERKATSYNKALEVYRKSETLKERAGKISGVGGTALKIAGVSTGLGYTTLNSAIKAESAFSDVKKQFDFSSEEIEKKFKTELQKLVTEKNIAISLEDLYGMAANAGQAGIKENEAISYIEAASKMAVAFGMGREQASQYMFIWKNAFGMDLDKLKTLTDQINILGNNTGATESQISEFITRLGNIPKIAGMVENQTAALGASLIEMGMTPEVAATGAKNVLNALTKGIKANSSERQAMELLGLEPEVLAKETQQDVEKALEKVMSRLSSISKDKQSAVLSMIFGEEGKVSASNLMNALPKFKANLELVKNRNLYGGATEKEYQNRANTTENKLQVLRTQFDILKADFGTELIPFLQEGINIITPFIQNLTKMMKENPEGLKKLIKTLVYGTGTLYGFGIGLKTVSLSMKAYSAGLNIYGQLTEKGFITKLKKSKKVFTGLAKGISTGGKVIKTFGLTLVSSLTSPVGLAIAGITALIIAGYTLYKNWDTVKQKAGELKKQVGELIDKYWFILGPLGAIIKAGKSVYENWDTIKNKLTELVVKSIENFNEFKEKAINILGIPFDYIGKKIDSLKGKAKDMKDYFLNIFEEIKEFSLKDWLKNKASKTVNKLKNNFGIPGYAQGGIITSPTLAMVGEGNSSESIIPLNNSERSLNLWEKTGRLIGAYRNKDNNQSYNEFKFTYAPVINAKDSNGVKEVLENNAKMTYQEFKSYFDRYQRENFRRGNNGR